MDRELRAQMEALWAAPIDQVRAKYRELFGEEPRSKHREPLLRQVAWRLQAVAEGGLSERARKRAMAIANEADLRLLPPRNGKASAYEQSLSHAPHRDPRIPLPGTVLQRDYDGATITVKVLAGAFEHGGKQYSSLSAVATAVTGTRWNGLAFFGLTSRSRGTERRDG